jgi:hypothetical protein
LALSTKILQVACTKRGYIKKEDKPEVFLWLRNVSITNSLTHNVVSLFNLPQKSGSLPEKLVLEILLLPVLIVKHYKKNSSKSTKAGKK